MSGSRKSSERGRWACAIAALLTERTQADAARRANVSEATLRRWMNNPKFLRLLRAARRGVLETTVGRLQQVAGRAVEALERNLTCGVPAAEIRAAAEILNQSVKGAELLDLTDRVQELEALLREVRGDETKRAG
jgi:hypothetical protein